MPVYLARRWRRQPSGALTVDWDNPLTQAIGLYVAWNGTTPGLRFRAPSNTLVNTIAAFDGPAIRNSRRGVQTSGVTMTAANNPDIDLGSIPAVTEFSCVVIGQSPSTAGFYVASRTSASVGGLDILSNAGAVTARVGVPGTNADSNIVTGQNDGFAHNYFATWKSGDFVKLYADNPRLSGNGSSTLSGTATSTQNLKIGNRNGGRLTGFVGLVLFGTKQNINAGLQLLENPWQIFEPQNNRLIFEEHQ
jgi:hypothetical protein